MNDIYINYGSNISEMTYSLLDRAKINEELKPDIKVLIKPNMVNLTPPSEGATTHAEIIEGIIMYLQDNEINDITIGEGSWVGVSNTFEAYNICGYDRLAEEYGIRLHDMKDDPPVKTDFEGSDYYVCSTVMEYDYIINVPVLKGHSQTCITCCMKNLKGLIPDKEKRRYHKMGLHKPIADINMIIRPDLHVVDSICGDLTFEEGGNPVESGRVLLGRNPVLLDSYCAGLLGYAPDEIEYLNIAKNYGLGEFASESTSIYEPDMKKRPTFPKSNSRIVKKLSGLVDEKSACSACYASLIFALYKLDPSDLEDLGLDEKIKIGQDFKGRTLTGLGIGNCTSGCPTNVKGCPPSGIDIFNFLTSLHNQ